MSDSTHDPTAGSVYAARYRRLRDELGEDHPETRMAHDARTAEVLAQESDAPSADEALWWLSFVDPNRAAPRGQQVPGGPGFLGVAIVEADGPVTAVMRAHELGINPGGEVKMYLIPASRIPHDYRDRFLDRDEAFAFNARLDGPTQTEPTEER